MTEPDPAQLVPLMTCRDNVEAMGVRALLESEGIEVFVQGEHHRAMEGMLLGAMIELRVMVRRADLDDARELMEEAEYAEHVPPEPSDAPIDDASIARFRERLDDPDADPPPEPAVTRRPIVAVALAILVPLGAGHIYARRIVTGAVIGGLELLNYILWLRGWFVLPAVLALVAADALWATVAIRRDAARAALPA